MNCRREYIEEKGYSYLNNNVLNEYALWLEQKLTETNQALQLQQTGVSGSTYAIYYDLNGMKMWLSPKETITEPYTCISHNFKRFKFSENELKDKILQLTKDHPSIVWLYDLVE